jgi:nitrite reductase/ring-hydroxylating ferredoxin subunit
MSVPQTIELDAADCPFTGLPARLLNGEIILLRNGLRKADLFEQLEAASYGGISASLGEEVAARVREVGLEKIHTVVDAADIPDVADAVYDIISRHSLDFLKVFIRETFGETRNFYFERKPNVRFLIPYDLAASPMKNYKQFTKRRGDGKITPHNPHRDSWVDCPANLINVWVAVGPVSTGNGLTIYPEAYHSDVKHTGPYISADQKPGPALTFDMEPGDVLLFHGDQVHGSEINSTDNTRHVISFRITFDKPKYTHGHYHHYAYSALAGGPLELFAEVPQNLAWSFVDYRARLVSRKLRELVTGGKPNGARAGMRPDSDAATAADDLSLPLTEINPGQIRALSAKICLARMENGEFRAFSRYCPHLGSDLSLGVIRNGVVMCPWHNLPLDPATGSSPCESLKKLRLYPCEVKDDRVYVNADSPS